MIKEYKSEQELLDFAKSFAGLTIGDIAKNKNYILPENLSRKKGWLGQFLEEILGASSSSLPQPDFKEIGVELKSIPIDTSLKPLESTYVCHINLHQLTNITWERSLVKLKLSKVLFVPIISEVRNVAGRIIASPFIWKPTQQQECILQNDWQDLIEMLSLGDIENISAKHGKYLQVRPKAANSKMRSKGVSYDGTYKSTLPRGFYLRAKFTEEILKDNLLI